MIVSPNGWTKRLENESNARRLCVTAALARGNLAYRPITRMSESLRIRAAQRASKTTLLEVELRKSADLTLLRRTK